MAAERAEYLPPASRSLRTMLLFATILAALLLVGIAVIRQEIQRRIASGVEAQLVECFPHLRWHVGEVRQTRRGLLLSSVRADLPVAHGERETPLLAIHQVRLDGKLGTGSLLLGTTRLDSVVLVRPRLHLDRDAEGEWNLSHLQPMLRFQDKTQPPELRIVDGQLQLSDARQGGSERFVIDNLQARLAPLPEAEGANWRLESSATSRYFDMLRVDGLLNTASGRWHVSGSSRSLEVNNLLLSLLPSEMVSGLVEEGTVVRCRADLDFQLAGDTTGSAPAAAQGQLLVRLIDGQLNDRRLPYPVGGLAGTIRWDRHGLFVDDLTAHCGMARLQASYHQHVEGDGPREDVSVSAYQLRIDKDVIERLPDSLREPLQTFAPVGILDVHWASRSDGAEPRQELTVAVRDASLQYVKFPYELDSVRGVIRFRDGTLTLDGFEAHAHGQTLAIEANIDDPFGHPQGWLRLAASGSVPIDNELLSSLQPRSEQFLRSLTPSGQVLLEEALFQYSGDRRPAHRRLLLKLYQGAVRYAGFPYPIDRIQGELQLEDDLWTIKNLSGVHGGGFVRCQGNWHVVAQEPILALDVTASDVPLDDDLRDALGTLDVNTWRFWNSLNPAGSLDQVAISIRRGQGDQRAHLSLAAEKFRVRREGRDGIRIKPNWFPYPLTNLCGAISYHRGKLVMSGMRAEHGATVLRLDGQGQINSGGDWRVDLHSFSADNLVVDYDLISALPGTIGPTLASLDVQGSFLINGRLQLGHRAGSERPIHANWDLTVDTAGGRLGGRLAMDKIFGGIRLQGRYDDRQSFSRGEIEIDSVQLQRQQLTALQGPVLLDEGQVLLGRWVPVEEPGAVPRKLVGKYAAGTVEIAAHLTRDADGQFLLAAQLLNGDLAYFSRDPVVGGPVGGRVDAQLQLAGQLGAVHSLRGLGHLSVRKANIEQAPLIMAVSKLLAPGEAAGKDFNSAKVDVRIQSDHLHLENIQLQGDAVNLRGSGWMNMDREIDLKLYSAVGRNEIRVPLVSTVLAEASKNLMEINVVGKLDEPEIKRTAFPELDDAMQRILADLEQRLPGQPPTLARPVDGTSPLRR